ncbi:cytoplasmic 60S subunit biogenesis factor ZNF622 [Hetaerina americana]|uniref:cytoplasmic 60S subunit biogenesis factor ZNF622 n=1 Tax=Hetaerina americana TaxID=62018 RepID=UPI003A7F298F
MMSTKTEIYTCIACRVAFKSSEVQRQHYKSDWHRYNLKRRVAELPHVTAEEFQRRVLLQREKDEAESKESSVYCNYCKKTFNNNNSYENHLHSKRHRDSVSDPMKAVGASASSNDHSKSQIASGSGSKNTKKNYSTDIVIAREIRTDKESLDISTDSEIEEVDSDEWEDISGDAIPVNDCLFCSHHSCNLEKNLKHMTVAHSFFVPDVEYVTDMNGLISYLGEKVGEGFMCLWCNTRGRTFYSIEAVRKHMIDKGHCKMLHEGEALAEYVDFYDYSSSYPTDSENSDEEVTIVVDDSDFTLTLPSGAVIGHRSLMRYYRQSFNPNRAVMPQKSIHRVLAQYKSLGCAITSAEALQRKARDVQYMKKVQAKSMLKLSMNANKFQKYYRPQVNF